MDNNKSMWRTVLITGNPPSKKKKESVSINELNQKLLVNTSDLMRLLSCGRPKAVETGTEAGAKVMLGRKVMWNVAAVRKHLDSIADNQCPALLR